MPCAEAGTGAPPSPWRIGSPIGSLIERYEMPEINALKPVSLRDVWADEARDFTPWLAEHLHLLGVELNLALELVAVEATLPEAGRVDIIAQQVSTMAKVVIENQLEVSDDSHCLRLLGYAANADANILVGWHGTSLPTTAASCRGSTKATTSRCTPWQLGLTGWVTP